MQEVEKKENATARYHRTKTIVYSLRFMKSTDAELIERLNAVSNRTGYIKRLIREDITRHPDTPTD